MEHNSVEGFIFRMFNSKEADRIVNLIDDHGSKVTLVAKGVKKPNSRKSYALDLLSKVKCKTTPAGNLDMITEIKLVKSPQILKDSYSGLVFIQLICEIVDQYIQSEQEERGYYANLESLINIRLNTNLALMAAAFLLRYLYINGSLPRLSYDVETEEQFSEGEMRYLSDQAGYTSHPMLSMNEPVPSRLLKVQRFILNNEFAEVQKINLTTAEQIQLLNIHVQWHYLSTERELKTLPLFLEALTTSTK